MAGCGYDDWMNGETNDETDMGGFFTNPGFGGPFSRSPGFSTDHRFAGSVSALFATEYLLSNIIGPVASNLPVDIFLMQKDGLMIYHVDPKQIGLNVFRDPLYKPFPGLLALARKVASTHEGTSVYRFFQKGSETQVAKVAYWRTVALHGATWRLVITCAEDSVEQ